MLRFTNLFLIFLALIGALLFCSCASPKPIRPALPPETSINSGAGLGDALLLNLRLADGEEVLCVVDTGAPKSILDSSLEPKLGKRLGTKGFGWVGENIQEAGHYNCPELYVGNTALVTSDTVFTTDLKNKFAPLGHAIPVRGLIGADILRHYCIQLDFVAGKMRFLDPDFLRIEDLGQASRLSIDFRGYPVVPDNFLGKGGKSIIDTGCNFDGVLTPKLFQQWTNGWPTASPVGAANFPNGQVSGLNYTNLYLHGDGGNNLIGLSFLARNLVTLNFPKQTMYLRQRSVGSLAGSDRFFDDFYPKELREQ